MNSTLLAVTQGKILEGFRWPLLAGLLAAILSWLFTPAVRNLAIQRGAIADPNVDDRRVHTEPTPQWGGLAIYAGFLGALAATLPFAYPRASFPPYLIAMLVIGALVVVMGALDDLYQFRASVQAAFLLAAGIAVQVLFDHTGRVQISSVAIPFSGDANSIISFGIWAVPLTAVYVFVVAKTMDTIDGIDGLAAGMATFAAATLTIIAAYGGQPRVAIVAAAIGGSALGFLRHNYNPAKIFMGAGGAQLLGFLLACLSIVGALKTAAAVALIVPVLAFGVPIFDAAFVVARRLLSRQPITQGDKRHLHHTLLNLGLSQRQAVLVLYGAAVALCGVLLVMVL
ncbi:MAG: undecaprenyl/decaprenyl-phosphate alpha-N-acetylglucosaminyl 1-phosphate transferase, partial [Fimbriimonas ginsengisoli]|nr:undecaprenyl/decaprenyl-phosphate alpha-N-acetylglucosaminyl 1-phosphate transferase [Fimbriimonas ginsengisoli]